MYSEYNFSLLSPPPSLSYSALNLPSSFSMSAWVLLGFYLIFFSEFSDSLSSSFMFFFSYISSFALLISSSFLSIYWLNFVLYFGSLQLKPPSTSSLICWRISLMLF